MRSCLSTPKKHHPIVDPLWCKGRHEQLGLYDFLVLHCQSVPLYTENNKVSQRDERKAEISAKENAAR